MRKSRRQKISGGFFVFCGLAVKDAEHCGGKPVREGCLAEGAGVRLLFQLLAGAGVGSGGTGAA